MGMPNQAYRPTLHPKADSDWLKLHCLYIIYAFQNDITNQTSTNLLSLCSNVLILNILVFFVMAN